MHKDKRTISIPFIERKKENKTKGKKAKKKDYKKNGIKLMVFKGVIVSSSA